MKVFIIVENYTADAYREEDNIKTHILSVHATREEAVDEVNALMKERIDDIMDGDENNASNVSYENEWDGNCACVGSCNCDDTEWVIVEREMKKVVI